MSSRAASSVSTTSASSTARGRCRPVAIWNSQTPRVGWRCTPQHAGDALELAEVNRAYEDVASKFWEHFIAHAMNTADGHGSSLWDDNDGFYYDVLHLPDGTHHPLKVRSMVGLIPLFAVEQLEPEALDRLPDFKRRLEWFIANRADLTRNVACMRTPGARERRLLAVVWPERLARVLEKLLDEDEFLSTVACAPSRVGTLRPYTLTVEGYEHRVQYSRRLVRWTLRQLELAGTVVPQLPAHRGAEVSPLLRRCASNAPRVRTDAHARG